MRDTQEQITQVGLSDRTAAQQASAIKMIETSRDAELAVYQDLLSSFNDWEWSTEFTPKPRTSATGGTATNIAADAAAEDAIYTNRTIPPTGRVRGNEDWRWDNEQGRWVAIE